MRRQVSGFVEHYALAAVGERPPDFFGNGRRSIIENAWIAELAHGHDHGDY